MLSGIKIQLIGFFRGRIPADPAQFSLQRAGIPHCSKGDWTGLLLSCVSQYQGSRGG